MRPDVSTETTIPAAAWSTARAELVEADRCLRVAPAGIVRQAPYDRLLAAQRRCTDLTHRWLAQAFGLEPVSEPCLVLSLDVDGVLEDETEDGFSSTGATGVAALCLLQLGHAAVVLNTARSLADVRDRVGQFHLMGGVAEMGAGLWDGVFGREWTLLDARATGDLNRLRSVVRADPDVVLSGDHENSVRATRVVEGQRLPISGAEARRLLDQHGFQDLAFWVAPQHTDFVDRSTDKGKGIVQITGELGLSGLPLAAIGDAACDLPMLRLAKSAFLPAATMPSYTGGRRQRLVRSRFLGNQALWDAASHLVPSPALQRQVIEIAGSLSFPEWFPSSLRRLPTSTTGLVPRLAAAFASMRGAD